MAVPLPRPLPAPVISTLFMVLPPVLGDSVGSLGSLPPGEAGSRHFPLFCGHSARDADRSGKRPVGAVDRDAPGEWDQASVCALGRGRGAARLAVLPQAL